MEISGIDKIQGVKKLGQKEGIKAVPIEDTVTTHSSEVQKKEQWVGMLKEMPEIRPEKIAAALSSKPHLEEIGSTLIERMMTQT